MKGWWILINRSSSSTEIFWMSFEFSPHYWHGNLITVLILKKSPFIHLISSYEHSKWFSRLENFLSTFNRTIKFPSPSTCAHLNPRNSEILIWKIFDSSLSTSAMFTIYYQKIENILSPSTSSDVFDCSECSRKDLYLLWNYQHRCQTRLEISSNGKWENRENICRMFAQCSHMFISFTIFWSFQEFSTVRISFTIRFVRMTTLSCVNSIFPWCEGRDEQWKALKKVTE